MSIQKKLEDDMKIAMKAKDTIKLDTIRLLRSEIKQLQIDKEIKTSAKGGDAKSAELTEEEVIGVLMSAIKKRKEAIELYEKGNRPDLVEKERKEMEIIQSYLPTQLSEDEIKQIIADAIKETGATSPKDMGKVMSIVAPKTKGRADGKLVSEMVKNALTPK